MVGGEEGVGGRRWSDRGRRKAKSSTNYVKSEKSTCTYTQGENYMQVSGDMEKQKIG